MTDCYYKVRQVLQSVTNCYCKVRQVLESVTDFITSASGITKCDIYYKVRLNNVVRDVILLSTQGVCVALIPSSTLN